MPRLLCTTHFQLPTSHTSSQLTLPPPPGCPQVETWLNIKSRLAPGGRVMAYLGEPSRSNTRALHAVSLAFKSSLSFFTFTDDGYANTIVLTGPAPDMVGWQARLSPELSNVFVNTNWTSLQ
jgi:hypothetical protein